MQEQKIDDLASEHAKRLQVIEELLNEQMARTARWSESSSAASHATARSPTSKTEANR
jgi:hypothetical protein